MMTYKQKDQLLNSYIWGDDGSAGYNEFPKAIVLMKQRLKIEEELDFVYFGITEDLFNRLMRIKNNELKLLECLGKLTRQAKQADKKN